MLPRPICSTRLKYWLEWHTTEHHQKGINISFRKITNGSLVCFSLKLSLIRVLLYRYSSLSFLAYNITLFPSYFSLFFYICFYNFLIFLIIKDIKDILSEQSARSRACILSPLHRITFQDHLIKVRIYKNSIFLMLHSKISSVTKL